LFPQRKLINKVLTWATRGVNNDAELFPKHLITKRIHRHVRSTILISDWNLEQVSDNTGQI